MQPNQLASQDTDLPLPNVYFVSVTHALTGQTHHMYIPADFNGSAFKKAQNLCAERHNFRPYRSNSVIKMRRLKLSDYLENPGALPAAAAVAAELGERDMVAALAKRPQEIAAMMEQRGETIDFDALAKALGEQLRTVDQMGAA